MKICILTANLGNFDERVDPVAQSIPADFFRFTDENFPPRYAAMTPRLQARICKTFGWQMVPGYDMYIWIDGSVSLRNPESVRWLTSHCTGDIVVFKHPDRNTCQEEADYIKTRIKNGCKYLTPRYDNELVDEEIKAISEFPDDQLFASTIIVYKNNEKVQAMMKEWWYHISRFHSVDQLGLPYAIKKTGCDVVIIPDHYGKNPYITLNKRK